MDLIARLSHLFLFTDLEEQFQKQTLYSPANDYRDQSDARLFCTHCGDRENLVDHPKLKHIYLCKQCLNEYNKNTWKQEEDHECDCCCCGDGGNVVLCDFCTHTVCNNCIMLHMGSEEVSCIESCQPSGSAYKRRINGSAFYVRKTLMEFRYLEKSNSCLLHTFISKSHSL